MEKSPVTRARRLSRRGLAALALVLALVAGAVCAAAPVAALADDEEAVATEESAEAEDATTWSVDEPPEISSPVALLVDATTGTVLYESGADDLRTPASLTKVMTALLVLENADLDDVVTVEEADLANVTSESTVAGLRAGESLTVRDLLAGMLIPSGADAAYVLARYVGGDWETFVDMMNARAAELGCASTTFVDPCGISSDNVSTARDLVTIFEAALAYPAFSEISGSETWDLSATELSEARTLENTNLLLDSDSAVYMGDTIVAGKTGFTYDAGKCLVAAAESDGMTLVGIVMGASYVEDENGVTANFYDLQDLFEWGFGAWVTEEVVSEGDVLTTREVEFSTDGDAVDAVATSAIVATVPRGTTLEDLTVTVSWSDEDALQAPVTEGTGLGLVTVAYGDRTLGSVDVAAATDMRLNIPSFAIWWVTSEPLHMGIVAGGFALILVLMGLISWHSARARRRIREAAGRPVVGQIEYGSDRTGRGGSGASRGSAPKHGRHAR